MSGRPIGKQVLRFMRQGLTYKQAQKKAHRLARLAWSNAHLSYRREYYNRERLLRMGEQKNCFKVMRDA